MKSVMLVWFLAQASCFAQSQSPPQAPSPAAAPLQSVNNQILQINNNLQTQQPTPLPTPTLTPLPENR